MEKFNAFFGRKADSTKMQQLESYQEKRKMSLVKRVYEKQRKNENLDWRNRRGLLRLYLYVAHRVDKVVTSKSFHYAIFSCILLSGVLAGLGTYEIFADNAILDVLNTVVIYAFLIEAALKIISEGIAPQLYFLGPHWQYNWFDFVIVVMSFAPVTGQHVRVLRLVRFLRITEVLSEIPQFQTILAGLLNAAAYNLNISLLLILIFYIFAILGMVLFRDNDPWNFGYIEVSMLTMLRIATLESWGDIFYLNYYGCDSYSVPYYTLNATAASDVFGGVMYCANPISRPLISTLYFISFAILTAFTILALFIAALSISIAESVFEKTRQNEQYRIELESKRVKELIALYANPDPANTGIIRLKKLITNAFSGRDLCEDEVQQFEFTNMKSAYACVSHECRRLLGSQYYLCFMLVVVVMSTLAIGFETITPQSPETASALSAIDTTVQYIFLFEFVLRLIAEEFQPWNYFKDWWNVLDFAILVVVFLPGSLQTHLLIFRLLRLLRIMKIIRVLPELRVIVIALLKGFGGIVVVSVLLFITLYVFGILGVLLFSTNDPWHFNSLHMALFVMLDAATLDNWTTALMYISLYGCAQYPWNYPELCTNSQPMFLYTSIFYVFFIFIGGLVMIQLFIGVVNISMEQAKYENAVREKIENRALKIANFDDLSRQSLRLYNEVFDTLDFTRSKKIGRVEMRFGLEVAGLHLSSHEFESLYTKVDIDKHTSGVDFSEFLKFMLDIRDAASPHDSTLRVIMRSKFVDEMNAKGVKKKPYKRRLILSPSKVAPLNTVIPIDSGFDPDNLNGDCGRSSKDAAAYKSGKSGKSGKSLRSYTRSLADLAISLSSRGLNNNNNKNNDSTDQASSSSLTRRKRPVPILSYFIRNNNGINKVTPRDRIFAEASSLSDRASFRRSVSIARMLNSDEFLSSNAVGSDSYRCSEKKHTLENNMQYQNQQQYKQFKPSISPINLDELKQRLFEFHNRRSNGNTKLLISSNRSMSGKGQDNVIMISTPRTALLDETRQERQNRNREALSGYSIINVPQNFEETTQISNLSSNNLSLLHRQTQQHLRPIMTPSPQFSSCSVGDLIQSTSDNRNSSCTLSNEPPASLNSAPIQTPVPPLTSAVSFKRKQFNASVIANSYIDSNDSSSRASTAPAIMHSTTTASKSTITLTNLVATHSSGPTGRSLADVVTDDAMWLPLTLSHQHERTIQNETGNHDELEIEMISAQAEYNYQEELTGEDTPLLCSSRDDENSKRCNSLIFPSALSFKNLSHRKLVDSTVSSNSSQQNCRRHLGRSPRSASCDSQEEYCHSNRHANKFMQNPPQSKDYHEPQFSHRVNQLSSKTLLLDHERTYTTEYADSHDLNQQSRTTPHLEIIVGQTDLLRQSLHTLLPKLDLPNNKAGVWIPPSTEGKHTHQKLQNDGTHSHDLNFVYNRSDDGRIES